MNKFLLVNDGIITNNFIGLEDSHSNIYDKKEIGVFIFNDNHELLLQKRSSNKKHFPNTWSICNGHVEDNEFPEFGALRELNEELGINACLDDLSSLFAVLDGNHATYYYLLKCNLNIDSFVLQTSELSEVNWVNINSVIDMIYNHDDSIVYGENRVKLFEYVRDIIKRY